MNNKDKFNDFRNKFSVGGWLDDNVNISTIEVWINENFKEEKIIKSKKTKDTNK